ncbi:hypothetical protein ACFQH3_13395 [Haladaptatus sp. GCM10025707]|uniref:DUF7533 family protein n=1 Tax=unclassified Haladaptatus TaxID=2622732 RepID=UPI0023E7A507|nr:MULTISPECIES: hypothetical protein [unclassified Haladaptatus]
MGKGIIGTIQLAIALAFAIPVGLLGLDMLSRGETLIGAGFIGLAVLMIAIEEYITTPGDLPGMAAKKVAGVVIKEKDEEE